MASLDDVLFPWLRPIRAQLVSLNTSPIIVAYSGGLDSTCLLHMLCQVVSPDRVIVLHVHHGLSSNADAWLHHCREVAQQWGCRFNTRSVLVKPRGAGVEAAAREARYQVFGEALSTGGVLLQGHHADDQLETVFLHLMRGSGPAGLKGIPQQRTCGHGEIWRPLLAVTREQLQAYAAHFGLSYVHDESNDCVDFDRNYLRKAVMPLLSKRFAQLYSAVLATTDAMADAESLQRALAWQDADLTRSVLPFDALMSLDPVRQRNVLRYWFCHHTGQVLPRQSMVALVHSVLNAKADACPELVVGEWRLQRSRQQLALLPVTEEVPLWQAIWDFREPLKTPYGTLVAVPVEGGWQFPSTVMVSHRRGGEKIRPFGRGVSKTLKALFKERDVPLWQRAALPLLWHTDTLLYVPDIAADESCAPIDGCMGWHIQWQPQILSIET